MSDKQKDLVARLAHELQAPLVSIELQLNKLASTTSDATAVAISAHCLLQVHHLQAILTNALALAKPFRETQTGPFEPTAITELFTVLGKRFRPLAEEASVRLHIESPASMPDVLAPQNVLDSIISALLDNAIKFSAAGGVVQLRASSDEPTANVVMEVSDQGRGVEEALRERVFEPFFRADRETLGAGLGLAIARELAIAHGGRVELAPRPERGLSCLVSFPRA